MASLFIHVHPQHQPLLEEEQRHQCGNEKARICVLAITFELRHKHYGELCVNMPCNVAFDQVEVGQMETCWSGAARGSSVAKDVH
jgi:hypothetical protein